MKKMIVGMLIGLILGIGFTLGGSVFADDIKSLIGLTVEGSFPLVVDGQKSDNDVIVVQGKSYAPVRKIGDLVGYDVSFDADLGVQLNKKVGVNKTMSTTVAETNADIQARHDKMEADSKLTNQEKDNINNQLMDIKSKIIYKKSEISTTQGIVTKYADPVMQHDDKIAHPDRDFDTWYKQFTDELSKLNADLLVLQKQSDDLQSQIDALNASTPSPTQTPTP